MVSGSLLLVVVTSLSVVGSTGAVLLNSVCRRYSLHDTLDSLCCLHTVHCVQIWDVM